MANKLKALGFKKRFFQSSQQFIYDAFLSYQAAAEECLPYTLFAGPPNPNGHTQCWAGVGLYVGWYGGLAITEFFQRKTGDLEGVVMIVNIKPFYDRISDLLDPFQDDTIPDGSSFDRAIVLDGAILGLGAIVIHEYLKEQYPGYQLQRQAIREHAGRTFDVIEIITADGSSKILHFALNSKSG
jgi:hypothetical protein